MISGDLAAPDVSDDELVTDVTREMSSYMERIHKDLGGPQSDLWAIVLAVSGRMSYNSPDRPDPLSVKLGVPDGPVARGRTRHGLWRSALMSALALLGDPEAHHRTGFDVATLSAAVERFFSAQGEANK